MKTRSGTIPYLWSLSKPWASSAPARLRHDKGWRFAFVQDFQALVCTLASDVARVLVDGLIDGSGGLDQVSMGAGT